VYPSASTRSTRGSARGEKLAHVRPVVGRPVRHPENDLAGVGRRGRSEPAQFPRRTAVRAAEHVVEASDAAKPRRERDVGDGQRGLVEQPLREVQPPRLRDGDRRRAHVRDEQAIEMPRADAHARGERFHGLTVQASIVDEPQRAADERGRAEPRGRPRRRFRAAAQARAVAGLGGGRRGRVVADVRALRAAHRADRAAVDAGRRDGDEEASVESRVAADARPIERPRVEAVDRVHPATIREDGLAYQPFSDIDVRGCLRPKPASAAGA
jgi:hypothetical protein